MTQRLEMLTKQLAIAKETEATEAAAEAARKQEEEKLIRSDPEAHGARVREAALALYRNNPTISFFYDPVMNPYGANPPGIAGEVYKTRDGKMTRNLDEALPFGEDETVGERRAREYKEGREKWEQSKIWDCCNQKGRRRKSTKSTFLKPNRTKICMRESLLIGHFLATSPTTLEKFSKLCDTFLDFGLLPF